MGTSLRSEILEWIRKSGWMQGFDRLFYGLNKLRFSSRNRKFKKANPGIPLPPDYMLYEAYRLDYGQYIDDGRNTAAALVREISAYADLSQAYILEWGCGPARIVRHLPTLLPGATIHGTDYNKETIDWCSKNIEGVSFNSNELDPPLNYSSRHFHLVYGLSVFTHLSGQNHYRWMDELYRIIKTGGILYLTTQGKAFLYKLTETEQKLFTAGKIVERARVKEGHRSFSAFQPESFMHTLFSDKWEVLKFTPGKEESWGPGQDSWLLRKMTDDR
jgi:hypothetical protein